MKEKIGLVGSGELADIVVLVARQYNLDLCVLDDIALQSVAKSPGLSFQYKRDTSKPSR